MPELETCAMVDSILAAFRSGMDVFKKMAGRRPPKKQARATKIDEEELQLHNSLARRPKEIKEEYERSVARHGHRFRAGDTEAHASLAHTLLVMNTGLIEIINRALSDDTRSSTSSRKSLLSLSEIAATNTLQTLAQLNDRINASLQLRSPPRLHGKDEQAGTVNSKKKRTESSSQAVVRPPSSPLLVRGGWVRSKSGSSVASAASARKPITQNVRDRGQHKSMAEPYGDRRNSAKKSQKSLDLPKSKDCSCEAATAQKKELPAIEASEVLPAYSQQRPPSMLIVPADYFEAIQTHSQEAPPRPPKIPIHTRPNPVQRLRPISGATFMTASTKIGEIPEHRLPDRQLSEEERIRIPLPYVIPPPLLEEPKKKRRGLRLWKRQESKQRVAAC